jgi:hypothetical protein
MALLKLRRHTYFVPVNNITVKQVSAGRFEVTYDRVVAEDGEVLDEGRTFTVVGGRAAGGTARDWWVHHPLFYGDQYLPCTSMIDAIRKGATY